MARKVRDIDSEVSFAGNLRSMPLEDLLGWLAVSSSTGTLVIDGPEFTKKLIVEKGILSASSSSNPKEFLSYYLVGWGIVTDAELDRLFELQKSKGALVGQLLVSSGLVTVGQLEEILTMVSEEVVFEAFSWTKGSFRFVECKLPAYSFHPVRIELEPLVLEGVRRRDKMQKIRRMVPSLKHRPRFKTVFDVTKLALDDLNTVTEFDGSRSIEEIALARRQRIFSTLERIASDVERGLVELLPPRPDAEPEGVVSVRALFLQAEESLERGQLIRAWTTVQELLKRFGAAKDIGVLTAVLIREIDAALQARGIDGSLVLGLALTNEELKGLECSPQEGFILSRIDGRLSLAEILKQIPGDHRFALLTVADLIDRGVLVPLW